MKITVKRAGGYSPALGPKHPDNQDPTLEHQASVEAFGDPMSGYRWRWSCSCKRRGSMVDDPGCASKDGGRHVDRMDRR